MLLYTQHRYLPVKEESGEQPVSRLVSKGGMTVVVATPIVVKYLCDLSRAPTATGSPDLSVC
jgi:hypothetical protein